MKQILTLILAILIIAPVSLASYQGISSSAKVSALNEMKAAMMANSVSAVTASRTSVYGGTVTRLGRRTPSTIFTTEKRDDIRSQGILKANTRSEKINSLYAQRADSRRLTTSRFSSSSFKFLGLGGLISK